MRKTAGVSKLKFHDIQRSQLGAGHCSKGAEKPVEGFREVMSITVRCVFWKESFGGGVKNGLQMANLKTGDQLEDFWTTSDSLNGQ